MRKTTLAAALAVGLSPCLAVAQTPAAPLPPDAPAGQQAMLQMMHLAAHNQLGVLRYCQDHGSVGADVVALQQKIIGLMPPATVAGEDQAEAEGKTGVVEFAGQKVNIEDAAKARGTTSDAMCKQIGTMLQSQAGNLPR